jgi:hypothetical protein
MNNEFSNFTQVDETNEPTVTKTQIDEVPIKIQFLNLTQK